MYFVQLISFKRLLECNNALTVLVSSLDLFLTLMLFSKENILSDAAEECGNARSCNIKPAELITTFLVGNSIPIFFWFSFFSYFIVVLK